MCPTPMDTRVKLPIALEALKPETELCFHGHHNHVMGLANSLAAIEVGANRIDAAAASLCAGAGNTPMEALVAVCDLMDI